ncbi:MAG: anaerobic glycerol-3-phosphate dehydrogenase subunit GlpA [Desulfovermiculus sp.]|nr:anaerobic glycerol-3-phosphate dehydrogenase subunit GlpA [Desulfovermiculus sp.]
MQTQVLIIGGGVTGTGLARDLTLRGISCILAEQRDINAGASGGNHGLLHSGARYVSSDSVSARECQEEAQILRRIAPHCIEDTGGLFVAVAGDDESYITEFPQACAQAHIPCQPLDPGEAWEMEPGLSQELIAAFAVNDASIDPFQISLDNISQAVQGGAEYLSHYRVIELERAKHKAVTGVQLQNTLTGEKIRIEPEIVMNASGAWAGETLKMAGLGLDMLYSKGTLAVTGTRLTRRVINRLRPPADGDILVPGGTVSILGTTAVTLPDLQTVRPTVEEVDTIVEQGQAMFPALGTTRYVRSYAGVRPLVTSEGSGTDRSVSRGYALIDHAPEGCPNVITVTGGKLTTFRLMAEKGTDLVAHKLKVDSSCQTDRQFLPSSKAGQWSEPGRSSKSWLHRAQPNDVVLCECEMIPQSHLDQVLNALDEHEVRSELNAFRVRSRLGKGACQGTFCSVRLANYLVDHNRYSGPRGLEEIKAFVRSRWIGQRPVLWNGQLSQAELSEALHCGLFGLELDQTEEWDARP